MKHLIFRSIGWPVMVCTVGFFVGWGSFIYIFHKRAGLAVTRFAADLWNEWILYDA